MSGAPVAGAGELKAERGKLLYLSNKSGHYHPDLFQLFQTLAQLQFHLVPMDFKVREEPAGILHMSVADFMAAHAVDNEAYRAQAMLAMYPPQALAQVLSRESAAFLTPQQQGVNTAGFHLIKGEGYDPYWIDPSRIQEWMSAAGVPATNAMAKPGVGR